MKFSRWKPPPQKQQERLGLLSSATSSSSVVVLMTDTEEVRPHNGEYRSHPHRSCSNNSFNGNGSCRPIKKNHSFLRNGVTVTNTNGTTGSTFISTTSTSTTTSSSSSSCGNTHTSGFMTSTILCFIVCSITIVLIDYHLEQSMTQQLLLLSSSSSLSGGTSKRTTSNKSPLNDPTLQWDDQQYPHVWLAYEHQQAEYARHQSSTSTIRNTNQTNFLPKPPYMILWTEYGWNHPQISVGLSYARCYRSTEYMQSIINHPYFHPTAYHEMIITQNRTVDPDITYYLFLDVETCYESNYPNYGKSYYGNCDATAILSSSSKIQAQRRRKKYTSFYIKHFRPKSSQCYDFQNCHYISKELQSNPIFQSSNNKNNKNKLILLDCRGNGQRLQFRHGNDVDIVTAVEADIPTTTGITTTTTTTRLDGRSPHVVLASLSSTVPQLNIPYGDQGLPPPPIQHIPYRTSSVSRSKDSTGNIGTSSALSDGQYQQEMVVENCSTTTLSPPTTSRKYLLSFSGDYKRHAVRQELAKLDNVRTSRSSISISGSSSTVTSESSLVLITSTKELYQNTNGMTYSELLLSSQYVAVPRGDNLYSYRFSEVLSSGAIPVLIHNQEWVLPFRPEIVDWDRCLIRISAEQIQNTVSILENISLHEQCQRRQYCYSIYERYMINSSATIQGILDGLQAMQQQHGSSI